MAESPRRAALLLGDQTREFCSTARERHACYRNGASTTPSETRALNGASPEASLGGSCGHTVLKEAATEHLHSREPAQAEWGQQPQGATEGQLTLQAGAATPACSTDYGGCSTGQQTWPELP